MPVVAFTEFSRLRPVRVDQRVFGSNADGVGVQTCLLGDEASPNVTTHFRHNGLNHSD